MTREHTILNFLDQFGLANFDGELRRDSPRANHRSRVNWKRIRSAFTGRPPQAENDEVKLLNPEIVHGLIGAFSEVVGMESDGLGETCVPGDWDRCAWHQSMHHFGSDWGIFVRQDCIVEHAREIARFLARGTPVTPAVVEGLLLAGFYSLYLHEEFHHRVESFGIRLEVTARIPLYCPYKDKVYRPTLFTDDNLEEALANANIYHRLGDSPYRHVLGADIYHATQAYLRWRFRFDPPGYRCAVDYLYGSQFDEGRSRLAAQIQEAALVPKQDPTPWNMVRDMSTGLFRISDRVWEAVNTAGQPVLFP